MRALDHREPAVAEATDGRPAPDGADVPGAVGEPARHRRRGRLAHWWRRVTGGATSARDEGMATAEYAIVTVAAVAFAGLLIAVLRSDEVRGLLLGIIQGALSV